MSKAKNIKVLGWHLLAMAIVLSLVSYFVLQWMDNYTHHGEAIVVPNVKDLPLEEALTSIEKEQLRYEVMDSDFVRGVPAGAILDQHPKAGEKVKSNRKVFLTVNTGHAPTVVIPNLIDNSSFRQADAKLRSMGFKMTTPEYVAGDKDWIYGIKWQGKQLRAGDKVPRESYLTLCVGGGSGDMQGETPSDSNSQDTQSSNSNDWF